MATRKHVALMMDLDWPYKYHQEVFAGTVRYGRERGWDCAVLPPAEHSLRGPGGRLYDGVIGRATAALARQSRRTHVPVVNVWQNSPAKDLPAVVTDSWAIGQMQAEHLLARGVRQFGFLGYSRDRHSRLQFEGFVRSLPQTGIPCQPCWVSPAYARSATNWRAFQRQVGRWIEGWPMPIGIGVAYDLLCRYLADACLRCGRRVPDDVALVSTDNEPAICEQPEPSLSSVECGCERRGWAAAELLDRLMEGQPPPAEPLRLAPLKLVLRRSSDVFAVGAPAVADALRFIAQHTGSCLSVTAVAGAVSVGRRTLERQFRRHLGRSVAEEVARLRVERAKRIIVDGQTPLKRISREAGFSSARQMWRVFRRLEGCSPQAYRYAQRL